MNDTVYLVFHKSVPMNRSGLTVFMLCRLCTKDFSELLLLCSNAHGFAALQILRSMFEKLVEATYLHLHADEVEDYWEFHLVNLKKLGWEDIAEKYEPEWKVIIQRFQTKNRKGKLRTQPRWSRDNLVKMAGDVGFKNILRECYYLPSLFVHNSPAEIMFSLKTEPDGSITPVDRGGEEERQFADIAFYQGFGLLLQTLSLVGDHYGWKENDLAIKEYADELVACIKSPKNAPVP